MPAMGQLFEPWAAFHTALAGAAAALVGLVIVAASVNIAKIVASPALVARLGSAVAGLLLALVATAFALIPGIDLTWFGVLVLISALVAGLFAAAAARALHADPDAGDVARIPKATLGFLPVVTYLVAGSLALFSAPQSLYVAAAGVILAIVSAVVVSWVALVEVLR
jgi:hypothetical protein